LAERFKWSRQIRADAMTRRASKQTLARRFRDQLDSKYRLLRLIQPGHKD
jgi:hypothetical protein